MHAYSKHYLIKDHIQIDVGCSNEYEDAIHPSNQYNTIHILLL